MPDVSVSGKIQEQISVTGKIIEQISVVKTLDEIFTIPIVFPENKVSTFYDGIDDCVHADGLAGGVVGNTQGAWTFRMKLTNPNSGVNQSPLAISEAAALGLMGFLFTPLTGILKFFMIANGAFKYTLESQAGLINKSGWAHIGITHDGVNAKLYYQGIPTASQIFASVTDLTAWASAGDGTFDTARIGCSSFGGGGDAAFFDGNIDEVRVWNVFKNDADILADHNGGTSIEPDSVGLVSSYRMGDDPGDIHPTIIDTISGHNGTMFNMSPASFVNDVSSS